MWGGAAYGRCQAHSGLGRGEGDRGHLAWLCCWPKGSYGKRMRGFRLAAALNDTVFVHAGLRKEWAKKEAEWGLPPLAFVTNV